MKQEEIVAKAQLKFWKEVAKLCKEAKSEDFPPVTQFQFDLSCNNAVHEWRKLNDPTYKEK